MTTPTTIPTELQTAVEFAASLKREYQVVLDDLCKKYEANIKELLSAIPGWKMIVVYGYTPQFNDGDACLHSQRVEVDDEVDDDLIDEYFGVDCDLPNQSYAFAHAIHSIFDQLERFMEQIHDTNWKIVYTRDSDGNVNRVQESYDCGW